MRQNHFDPSKIFSWSDLFLLWLGGALSTLSVILVAGLLGFEAKDMAAFAISISVAGHIIFRTDLLGMLRQYLAERNAVICLHINNVAVNSIDGAHAQSSNKSLKSWGLFDELSTYIEEKESCAVYQKLYPVVSLNRATHLLRSGELKLAAQLYARVAWRCGSRPEVDFKLATATALNYWGNAALMDANCDQAITSFNNSSVVIQELKDRGRVGESECTILTSRNYIGIVRSLILKSEYGKAVRTIERCISELLTSRFSDSTLRFILGECQLLKAILLLILGRFKDGLKCARIVASYSPTLPAHRGRNLALEALITESRALASIGMVAHQITSLDDVGLTNLLTYEKLRKISVGGSCVRRLRNTQWRRMYERCENAGLQIDRTALRDTTHFALNVLDYYRLADARLSELEHFDQVRVGKWLGTPFSWTCRVSPADLSEYFVLCAMSNVTLLECTPESGLHTGLDELTARPNISTRLGRLVFSQPSIGNSSGG